MSPVGLNGVHRASSDTQAFAVGGKHVAAWSWRLGSSPAAAEALDRSDIGGVAVDTTSLSPDESASMIRHAIDWP
jgi:hypothetical protein